MVRPMTWTDEKPRPAGRDPSAEGVELEGTDLFDAAPREAPWTGLLAATPDATDASDAQASGPLPGADVLLEGLNEAQRQACLHGSGPLLILAGPGSGKTRVITTRIAHLITARAVDPREILAITFTNKAAREMRERVEATLGTLNGLWISTFHSMCARILRRDIEALGSYTRDFSIFDTSDRNALLKKLIKELGYDPQRFRPAAVGAWISKHKNSDGAGGELELEAAEVGSGMDEEVHKRVLARYQEALETQNALDFDDLLLLVLKLFDTQLGVRDSYARRFRYVMVDEYQDTNRVQYRLVQHLASHHGNLAVCGDPDQSIYGWRGADIRNILDFEEDHPDPVTVRLEQNYRSTGNILAAASAVIANNGERKEKGLWTEGDDGELLVVVECGDENDEAREIALQIKSLEAQGHSFSEAAIFYRVNFMQRALESALRLARVPYQVVAGLEFYARREVRDLVSYLRLIVNPADGAAFARVVNSPTRGIGATSLGRLGAWATEHGSTMLEACRSEEALNEIRGRARKALPIFASMLERLGDAREGSAAEALERVLKAIEPDRWMREMDDGSGTADREGNVEELCAYAAEYDLLQPEGGLRGFLENVALVSDADAPDAEPDGGGAVKLMTLHACKGLEFPFVFVAGLEDELLPHARATDEDPEGGLEEERRLLYVGMTRARERLFLTHATVRTVFGADHWQRPSPFLSEIPTELVEGGMAGGESATDFGEVSEGLGEYAPDGDELQLCVGARVEHAHFGPGRVTQLSGAGINARATVDFVHHGRKELLLQYAKLERLEG